MSQKKRALPAIVASALAVGAALAVSISFRASESGRRAILFASRPAAEPRSEASTAPLEPELLEASAGPLSFAAFSPRVSARPAAEGENGPAVSASAKPLRDALAPIPAGSGSRPSFPAPRGAGASIASTGAGGSASPAADRPLRAALAAGRAVAAAGAASRGQAIARLRFPGGAPASHVSARPFAAAPAQANARNSLAETVWSAMETEAPAPNVAVSFSASARGGSSAGSIASSRGSGGSAAALQDARVGDVSSSGTKANAKTPLPGAHMSHQQKYALFWAFARAKLGPKVFRRYRLRGMTILLALRRSTNANHAYPDRFVFLTRHDFVVLQGSTQPSSSRAGISMIKPGRYLGVHNGVHVNAIGLAGPSWWIKTLDGSGALPDWRDRDGDGRYRGRGEAYNSTAYEILLHIGRSSIGCLNYRPADTQRVVRAIGGPSRDFVMVLSQVK